MMPKRRDRAVKELYDLAGNLRKEASPSEKRIVKCATKEKYLMRGESGTCNVCATPCSSCMHFGLAVSVMESKVEDEFSDDSDMLHCFKRRACDDRQHAASEASNLLSASSSHDSLSENAQSKATMRTCDSPDGFEDRLECHGDNISFVTAEESRGVTTKNDRLQKTCSGITSETADISYKSDPPVLPSSNDAHACNNFPNLQIPHCHSRKGDSLFSLGDSKDFQENASSNEEPPGCSTVHDDFILAGASKCKTVDGQASVALASLRIVPNIEGGKTSLSKCSSPTCTGTEGNKDGNPPTKQSEKSSAFFEVFPKQEPHAQSQLISESENSGSDMVEDDVKVCDICGDTGREEMLAICSRCSDGAEHTYCMKVMLDKVPDGEWLCEECQLKQDSEKQKVDKTERMSTTTKVSYLNEKIHTLGGAFNTKLLCKLDTKSSEGEGKQAVKVAATSNVSSKRLGENLKVPSVSKRQAIETATGSPRTTSPTIRPALTRKSSFKNSNIGKVKLGQSLPLSTSHSGNSYNKLGRSLTAPGPNSSMSPAFLQSPRGLLTRSATFNDSNSKPKVKQIFKEVSQQKKLARDTFTSCTRKEGLMQTISKSLSVKCTGSSESNSNESIAKIRFSNYSHAEDPRGFKQSKERNLIERKNSFKSDCSTVGLSPTLSPRNIFHDASMPLIGSMNDSHDPKVVRHDGKSNTPSDPTTTTKKGSKNLIASVKKQSLSLYGGFVIPLLNGKHHSEEPKICPVGLKEDTATSFSHVADRLGCCRDVPFQNGIILSQESTNEDGKTKEPSTFRLSGQNVSSGNGSKYIRCHRCNQVGHVAQCCTIGSLRVSALKASAVRHSREVINKSNKWKDAVEATMRTKLHKSNGLPNQDELSFSGNDLSSEVAYKDQLSSSSSCLRNFSFQGGTFGEQEALRSFTTDSRSIASTSTSTINPEQHAVHPTTILFSSREKKLDIAPVSDENKPKPFMLNLPTLAFEVVNCFRMSAIPECDCIWMGGFEVQRSGRSPDLCDGIQAHLSTCASLKILEVAKKFPRKLYLEEAPRLSTWPIQVQGDCITEDNIALYFFAKDLDSYETNYKKLMDNMIKDDLALKGNFEGIELLIFPSNQLPEKSQRWNSLFFLWALFRVRSQNFSNLNSDSHKQLFGASSNLVPSINDTCIPAVLGDTVSQKLCSEGHMDQESSGCARAPEAMKSTSLDLPLLSPSMLGHDYTCIAGRALNQRSTFREFKESAVDDTHSSAKNSFRKLKESTVDDTHSSCLSSSGKGVGDTSETGSTLNQRSGFHGLKELVVDDTHSSEKISSCLFPELRPSVSVSRLASLGEVCSLTRIPMKNSQLSSELNGKCTSLKEVYIDTESGKEMKLQPSAQATTVLSILDKGKPVLMCPDMSTCSQEGFISGPTDRPDTASISPRMLPFTTHVPEVASAGSRDQEEIDLDKERSMDGVASLEVDVWRERTKHKLKTEDLRSGRKSLHSSSSETITEASGEKLKNREAVLHQGMTNYILVDGGQEREKMRTSSHERILGNRSSPEVVELQPGILNEEQKGYCTDDDTVIISMNMRTTERKLSPVNSGPVRDLVLGNSITLQIVSSDDEDPSDSDFPNLELALGAVNKPSKQGILPLLVPLVDAKSNPSEVRDLMTDDGDGDVPASLSLSLAFPFSQKEQTAKSASKDELILPERQNHANTSLLLFGGFTDT